MAFNLMSVLTGQFIIDWMFPPEEPAGPSVSAKDLGAPTTNEGGEIPVVWGSVNIPNYLVVWFGDVGASNDTGFAEYSMSMQAALCMGPVDYLRRVRVDKQLVWVGKLEGIHEEVPDDYESDAQIMARSCFGGESKGGGIEGGLSFYTGTPDQVANSFIQEFEDDPESVPAYRRVATVALENCYIGTSPQMKGFEFLVQRCRKNIDGTEHTAFHEIKSLGATTTSTKFQIAIGMYSPSIGDFITGALALTAGLQFIKDTYIGEIEVDLKIFLFDSVGATDVNTYLDADAADLDAAIAVVEGWVVGLPGTSGTAASPGTAKYPWDTLATSMLAFWDPADEVTRLFVPMVQKDQTSYMGIAATEMGGSGSTGAWDYADYEETVTALTAFRLGSVGVRPAQIALTDAIVGTSYRQYADSVNGNVYQGQYLLADGTNEPGTLPIAMTSSGNAFLTLFTGVDSVIYDANPAWIIKECLLDANFGLGLTLADIDDASFNTAASFLAAEGLGMSIMLQQQAEIASFINDVLRHIDAVLYINRRTGKFVLKLIRNTSTSVATLTEADIEQVTDFSLNSLGELVNSVTVTYSDPSTGESPTLTFQSMADIEVQGNVINAKVEYRGFTSRRNATRAGLRDLRTLGTPLATCAIVTKLDPTISINPGDMILVTWAPYGLDQTAMRVTSIEYGDSVEDKIRIKCIQDIFKFNADLTPAEKPKPVKFRPSTAVALAYELPYWQLCQKMGQAKVSSLLGDDVTAPTTGAVSPFDDIEPDTDKCASGRIGVICASPYASKYQSPTLFTSSYQTTGGWVERETRPHTPIAQITKDNTNTSTTWLNANATQLEITFGNDYTTTQVKKLVGFGGFALISNGTSYGELVYVTANARSVGGSRKLDLTVRRGMLDTACKGWTLSGPGTFLYLIDGYEMFDSVDYGLPLSYRDLNGPVRVNCKIRTRTKDGVLPISAAPVTAYEFLDNEDFEDREESIAFAAGRAYRPPLPGQIEIASGAEGSETWGPVNFNGTTTAGVSFVGGGTVRKMKLRWNTRYRLEATSGNAPYGFIGPDVEPVVNAYTNRTFVQLTRPSISGSNHNHMSVKEVTSNAGYDVGETHAFELGSVINGTEHPRRNSFQKYEFSVLFA